MPDQSSQTIPSPANTPALSDNTQMRVKVAEVELRIEQVNTAFDTLRIGCNDKAVEGGYCPENVKKVNAWASRMQVLTQGIKDADKQARGILEMQAQVADVAGQANNLLIETSASLERFQDKCERRATDIFSILLQEPDRFRSLVNALGPAVPSQIRDCLQLQVPINNVPSSGTVKPGTPSGPTEPELRMLIADLQEEVQHAKGAGEARQKTVNNINRQLKHSRRMAEKRRIAVKSIATEAKNNKVEFDAILAEKDRALESRDRELAELKLQQRGYLKRELHIQQLSSQAREDDECLPRGAEEITELQQSLESEMDKSVAMEN
ncbi:hypothetical protein G7046_g4572 [Stylonectria norvegica]|nr:hypothetical protein G7046_g4572 [Stylonectria norvegica]